MQPPPVTARVRKIFISSAALLIAQTLFIRRYDEPYPAIVMPGFAGSGGYRDGRVELSQYDAVFVADGQEFSFPPRVLLEEFPVNEQGAIAFTCFRPRGGPPQGSEGGSRPAGRLYAIFPGYEVGARSRSSPENIASLRKWLGGRARALLPGRQPSRVEFRWSRETVRLDGGELHTEREPTGALVIPLEGDQG
jgi:hypothetical protein